MSSLEVQTPDGKTLEVDVPQGTNPNNFGSLADDALSHYKSQNQDWSDLPKNAVAELKQTESGVPEMAKNLSSLTAISSGGLPTVGDISQIGRMAGQVPGMVSGLLSNLKNTVTNPKQELIQHPIGTAVNVASLVAPFLAPEAEAAKVVNPEGIGQRLAARTTTQALDINPRALGRLTTKAGATPEQAALDLGTKANELIPDLIKPLDTANMKLGKVIDAHDAAGQTIGDIVKSTTKGSETALPEAQQTIDSLRSAAKEYYQVDGGEQSLLKTADRLEALQKDGKLDFDRLSKVKTAVGKGFNKRNIPPGTEDTYQILNDGLDKALERVSSDNPNLGAQFDKAKEIYTVTSRLIPAMNWTATREVAGASVGGGVLSKVLPGAVGGAIGGLPGMLAGAGAKYLQEAIAPDLGKNLAYLSMNPVSKIAGAIGSAPGNLARGAGNAAVASSAMNKNQIVDLIQKLKQKYDQRRAM